MKRLLPMLLALLAMFYATPRLACMCGESNVQTSAVAQASPNCCKTYSIPHCQTGKKFFGNTKGCCGMIGNSSPLLASRSYLQSNLEQVPFHVVTLISLVAPCKSTPTDYVVCTNRAPPRLTGMGTSKTYLFKRTLLI